MKKLILVVCALFSAVALVSYVYAQVETIDDEYIEMGGTVKVPVVNADKIPYGNSPVNKLDRGLINGATFWTEIPAEVAKVSNETNPAMGMTVGIVQGTITGVVRAGTAVFDTLTFFVPPYNKPVMKPEYALNRADDEIRDYLW